MHAFLLFLFLSPALIGHHFLDESHSSIYGQGKECSSSSDIHVPLPHGHEPLIEVLEHEPVLHLVVWAGLDVILQPLPCLGGWIPKKFARSLKFSPLGHWFCPWGKLCEERRGTFVPCVDSFLLFIEPLSRLPREGEGKQTELDASWCDVFDDDGVVQLQEGLQVCTCILAWQAIELACLHHRYQASLEVKVFGTRVDSGPNGHVGNSGGGVVAE